MATVTSVRDDLDPAKKSEGQNPDEDKEGTVSREAQREAVDHPGMEFEATPDDPDKGKNWHPDAKSLIKAFVAVLERERPRCQLSVAEQAFLKSSGIDDEWTWTRKGFDQSQRLPYARWLAKTLNAQLAKLEAVTGARDE